ncbi:MAG: hypothetical protein JXD22_16000 [Sedimentisphaerales bacterium]|nr:hypothetical protein [Sedimentisphaerales bacterium]
MGEKVEYLADGVGKSSLKRNQVDKLLLRMDLLEQEDRLLLDLYMNHQVKASKLAQLSGMSRGTVYRRINRMIERLLGEEFITIYRCKKQFGQEQMAVAYDRFLLGMGVRRISEKRGIGRRRVRRIVEEMEDFLKSEEDES